MSWEFSPTLPAAAQLNVNDGLAVGALPVVTAQTADGSASGLAFNIVQAYSVVEVPRRVSAAFSPAVRLLLILGVQLAVATGAGVTDNASAPAATATGAALATGSGATDTATSPSGTATGAGQGSATGAGVSDTASAPAATAAGQGAATGAGVSVSVGSLSGSAAGQNNFFAIRTQFHTTERIYRASAQIASRMMLLWWLQPSASASGNLSTVTTNAPAGSADGGGIPGSATGAGPAAQAWPPFGTAAPPYTFTLVQSMRSFDRTWSIPRTRAVQLLLLGQTIGAATGAVDTATALAPSGGATGDLPRGVGQSRFVSDPLPTAFGRSTAGYLALINSFGPDYPVALQAQWDESSQPVRWSFGRPYPWTLIILGQTTATPSGAGATATTIAPSAFATGDNAGTATGAGSTATTSAPAATGAGNTNVVVAGFTITASTPTGSATGNGLALTSIPVNLASAPDGVAFGGGAGNAVGAAGTAFAQPPDGAAGVAVIAVGIGATANAFAANALAAGDAAAFGQISTATASAPDITGPVIIGEITVTITQYRHRVTIT
jgi:hypothetical protein